MILARELNPQIWALNINSIFGTKLTLKAYTGDRKNQQKKVTPSQDKTWEDLRFQPDALLSEITWQLPVKEHLNWLLLVHQLTLELGITSNSKLAQRGEPQTGTPEVPCSILTGGTCNFILLIFSFLTCKPLMPTLPTLYNYKKVVYRRT